MVYLYWRWRVKLWEGVWADLSFQLLLRKEKGTYPSLVFNFCAGLVGSLLTLYWPWDSSDPLYELIHFTGSAENTSRRKGQLHLLCWGVELAQLGPNKSQKECRRLHGQDWWRRESPRDCRKRRQDLAVIQAYVDLICEIELYQRDKTLSLRLNGISPGCWDKSFSTVFLFLLSVQKGQGPWERIAKTLTVSRLWETWWDQVGRADWEHTNAGIAWGVWPFLCRLVTLPYSHDHPNLTLQWMTCLLG